MKRVAVLLYPGCIFAEIAPAAELLAARTALRFLTPQGRPHRASNGALIVPDGAYAEARGADAVLVPGGDPRELVLGPPVAREALVPAHDAGAVIGGICAGVLVMAHAGLLKGRRATHNYTPEFAPPEKVAATAPIFEGLRHERADLVQDGRLITANHWAPRRFAAAVALALAVFDEPQARAYLDKEQR